MFEVGMEFIRNQAHAWEVGEITSISEDANGITLIDVLFEDGAVKTYTEDLSLIHI